MDWKKLEDSVFFIVNLAYKDKTQSSPSESSIIYLSKKCFEICKKQIKFIIAEFSNASTEENCREMLIDDPSINGLELFKKHLDQIDKTIDNYYLNQSALEHSLHNASFSQHPPSVIEKLIGKLESIKQYEPDFILNIRDISFDSWKEALNFEKVMCSQRKYYENLINKQDRKWRSRCEFIKNKSALKIISLEKSISDYQEKIIMLKEHMNIRYEDLYGIILRNVKQEEEFIAAMNSAGYKDLNSMLIGLNSVEELKLKFQTQVERLNKEIKNLKNKVAVGNHKMDEVKKRMGKAEEEVKELEGCVGRFGDILTVSFKEKSRFNKILAEKNYGKVADYAKYLDGEKKNREEKRRREEEKEKDMEFRILEERRKKEEENFRMDQEKRKKEENRWKREDEKRYVRKEIKEKGRYKTKEDSVEADEKYEENNEGSLDKALDRTEKREENLEKQAKIMITKDNSRREYRKIIEKQRRSPSFTNENSSENTDLANGEDAVEEKVLLNQKIENKTDKSYADNQKNASNLYSKRNPKVSLPTAAHTSKSSLQKTSSLQSIKTPKLFKPQPLLGGKSNSNSKLPKTNAFPMHENQNSSVQPSKRMISPIQTQETKLNYSMNSAHTLNDSINSIKSSKSTSKLLAEKENTEKSSKMSNKYEKFENLYKKSLNPINMSSYKTLEKPQKIKPIYKSQTNHSIIKSLKKVFSNHLFSLTKISTLPKESIQKLNTLKSMPLEEILSIKLNLNGNAKTLQEITIENIENCLKTGAGTIDWESIKPIPQNDRNNEYIGLYRYEILDRDEESSEKILRSNGYLIKNVENNKKVKKIVSGNWRTCTLKLFVLVEEYLEMLENSQHKNLAKIVEEKIVSGVRDDIILYIEKSDDQEDTIKSLLPLISRSRKYELLYKIHNIDNSAPYADWKSEKSNVFNKIRWTNLISKIKDRDYKRKKQGKKIEGGESEFEHAKSLSVIESNENIIRKNRVNYANEQTAHKNSKPNHEESLNVSSKNLLYVLPQIQKTPRFPEKSFNLLPNSLFLSDHWVKNTHKNFK